MKGITTKRSPSGEDTRTGGGQQVVDRALEQDLLAQARQGGEEAFTALFELYKRRVYGLCLRMTNDPVEAEDLCQDAFLLFFRKISSFRGESALSTWLHRLVVNVVLMHLRRKSVPQVPLDTADRAGDKMKRQYAMIDTRLTYTVDRLALSRAIEKLPQGYRTVFVLHDIEGYKHSEIAQMANRSEGNCKSQLHKARLKLRVFLSAQGNDGDTRTMAASSP